MIPMEACDCQDLYSDGRHYDLINRDIVDDIPFYLDKIKRYGEPVLELGCGTGRITIPLTEAGCDVTGLDISLPMLRHAREKAASRTVDIHIFKADCRQFALNSKFKLIIFPFNALNHIHNLESMEAFLACVRDHLAENGRFIIDIFNPRHDILIRDPLKRYIIEEYPDPDGRGNVVIRESNYYDTAAQINRLLWYFYINNEEIFSAQFNQRIYYPRELDALIGYNGFSIEAKYGYYDKSPFDSKSRKQIVVSTKIR